MRNSRSRELRLIFEKRSLANSKSNCNRRKKKSLSQVSSVCQSWFTTTLKEQMTYRHLTLADRFIIEEMLKKEQNLSAIARSLGVHRSTISREIRRNKGARGYFGKGAQLIMRSRRPCLVEYARKIKDEIEEHVRKLLYDAWSPEQISRRLKIEKNISISHESIYRYILFDQRNGGRLYRRLRRSRCDRKRYQKRLASAFYGGRRSIRERPEAANLRIEIGHWERDLICDSSKSSALLTAVDRKSRFTKIARVRSFKTEEVSRVTTEMLANLPCLTITNDNGVEFSRPFELEKTLRTEVYFANPYSSWERGTNENTNGLIRQFFPKKTRIAEIEDWMIRKAEELLNHRPRKILGWKTPYETFFGVETRLVN